MLKNTSHDADPYTAMIRFRSRSKNPRPPLTVPRLNGRVAVLADGARYGGRLDDVVPGALVVAAPDAAFLPDRPVLLQWRDDAGAAWQLPCTVSETRELPFPTTTLRPTGASECISEAQVDVPGGGLRVTARTAQSSRLPAGTRVPVTSLQLVGDRIAFWTILPLQPGDHVEVSAREADGSLLHVGLVVASVHASASSWLARVDCDVENPYAPAVGRLVAQLLAAAAPVVAGAA
jgi:hypothetical protein